MKLLLAFCLTVYFLVEVSATPAPQSMDQTSDLYETVKQRVQETLAEAKETVTRFLETARNAMQNGFQSAQQVAQSNVELGGDSTKSETDVNQTNDDAKA